MRIARRVALGLLALVIALAIAAIALGSSTTYSETPTSYIFRPGEPKPPSWSRPCRRREHGPGPAYVLRCGRVEGVIVYRESSDPDGDGEVHGLAVAGHRLLILKSRRGLSGGARIPGVGHGVDLAGPVLEGRWGLTMIDVRRSQGRR